MGSLNFKAKSKNSSFRTQNTISWMELVYYCFYNKKMFFEIHEPFQKIYSFTYIGLQLSFDNSQISEQRFSPLLETNITNKKMIPIWLQNLINNRNCKEFIYVIYDNLIVPIPFEQTKTNNYDDNLKQLSYFINKSHIEAKRIYGSFADSMILLPKQSGSMIIQTL